MMKKKGFTLIELLAGMTLMVIFMGFVFQFTQTLQLGEKKLRISKDFQGETRFLLDKLISVTRSNTIDYDRYFREIGPDDTACAYFDDLQLPVLTSNTDPCNSQKNNGTGNCENDATDGADNRKKFSYPDIFYWDTNNDKVPDRQFGGLLKNSDVDDCTIAFTAEEIDDGDNALNSGDLFNGLNSTLFLINSDRDKRFAFRLMEYEEDCDNDPTDDTSDGSSVEYCKRLTQQIQISADTDNDGKADLWAPIDEDQDGVFDVGDTQIEWDPSDDLCKIVTDESDPDARHPIMDLDIDNASDCEIAGHDWTSVSLKALDVNRLNFSVSPNKDPYLAFRDNNVQEHPKVTFNLVTRLKDPEKYSFDETNRPSLNIQTTISSRVYGNSRK